MESELVSADVLEKAKKWLLKETPDWQDGVCYGGIMTLDGHITLGATYCHSWVSREFAMLCGGYRWTEKYKKGVKPFLTLTCHSRKMSKASQEATDAIILWMAGEDSPFSSFILNRDDPKSLTEGGAVIFCGPGGASHCQAMWMCKVLRYTTEGQQALDTWMTLYNSGVNPLLAILIATHVSSVKGATFSAVSVSNHVTVFGGYEDRDVNLYDVMSFSFNKEATSTSSLFSTPGKGRKDLTTVAGKVSEFCRPFEKDDGWGGKVKGTGCSGEELVKRVLEWQEELGGYTKAGLVRSDPLPPPPPSASTVYLDVDL